MKHDSNTTAKNLIGVLLLGSVAWIAAGCAGAPARVDDARVDCGPKTCRYTCKIFEKADAGSARHQTMLGETYAVGQPPCVPRDPEAALAWYRRAAAHGDAKAMFRTAEALQYGRGTAVDEVEAMRWYARAVKAGYDDAWTRKVHVEKYGPPDAEASYDALAVRNSAVLAQERKQEIAKLGTIAVAGDWEDGRPVIKRPRRAAADVTGKLGVSALVGGTLAAGGGGAIGAALYAVIIATAGIKDGIEKGKAGKAIHEALSPIFADLDLEQMVRDELQELLDETEGQSTPSSLVVAADAPPEGRADTLIELTFGPAELDNVVRAWQFERSARPGLVLVIETRVRALRARDGRMLFTETIQYKGHQLLNGLEEPFRVEVREAAHYIAGRILLRLADLDKIPDPDAT